MAVDVTMSNIDDIDFHHEFDEIMAKYRGEFENPRSGDLREAQNYAAQAYEAYKDFNHISGDDKPTKDLCLAIGANSIYNALSIVFTYFQYYPEMKDKSKKIEDYDKYYFLYKQLFQIHLNSGALTSHIKYLTTHNKYNNVTHSTEAERRAQAWREISIFKRGFKIYDLKELLEFYESLMQVEKECRLGKKENPFIRTMNGKYSSYGIFIGSGFLQCDPATLKPENVKEYCSRVYYLFKDALLAMLFQELQDNLKANKDTDIDEIIDMVDKDCKQYDQIAREIDKNRYILFVFENISRRGYNEDSNYNRVIINNGEDLMRVYEMVRKHLIDSQL